MNIVLELTFDEVKAIRNALGKATSNDRVLMKAINSSIDKIDEQIKQVGYVRERKALPKRKFQKNTYYEYVYTPLQK